MHKINTEKIEDACKNLANTNDQDFRRKFRSCRITFVLLSWRDKQRLALFLQNLFQKIREDSIFSPLPNIKIVCRKIFSLRGCPDLENTIPKSKDKLFENIFTKLKRLLSIFKDAKPKQWSVEQVCECFSSFNFRDFFKLAGMVPKTTYWIKPNFFLFEFLLSLLNSLLSELKAALYRSAGDKNYKLEDARYPFLIEFLESFKKITKIFTTYSKIISIQRS